MNTELRERLMQKNNVTELKQKPDKVRIAELEQENAELMDAVLELAEIIVGGDE